MLAATHATVYCLFVSCTIQQQNRSSTQHYLAEQRTGYGNSCRPCCTRFNKWHTITKNSL